MPYKNLDDKRAYHRKWMAARRKAWLDSNGPCKQCGSSTDLRVDHVDSKQKVSHKVWSWTESRRLEELAKCQVLCFRCHVKKTLLNKENSRGTALGKLLDEQVIEARQLYRSGKTFRELGNRYGVHPDTVRYCVRRGWQHLNHLEAPIGVVHRLESG